MRDRERRLKESAVMLRQSLPSFAVNVFIAVLLWLFVASIFIPITLTTFDPAWSPRVAALVGLIFLVAILVFVTKIIDNGRRVVDALSTIIASRYSKVDYERRCSFFKHVGYALLTLLIYLLTSTILGWIHPLFGGMATIASVIMVFYHLFLALNAVSDVLIEKIVGTSSRDI